MKATNLKICVICDEEVNFYDFEEHQPCFEALIKEREAKKPEMNITFALQKKAVVILEQRNIDAAFLGDGLWKLTYQLQKFNGAPKVEYKTAKYLVQLAGLDLEEEANAQLQITTLNEDKQEQQPIKQRGRRGRPAGSKNKRQAKPVSRSTNVPSSRKPRSDKGQKRGVHNKSKRK